MNRPLTTNKTCPLCEGQNALILPSANDYDRFHCQQCDVIFSDPMQNPGAEWYQQSDVYKERRERTTPIPLAVIRKDWRFKTFLNLQIQSGGQLLDVGCGAGIFLKLAKLEGYQIQGIESDPLAVATAAKLYGVNNIATQSIEDFINAESSECFDIITLFDVLEHLTNPREVLEALEMRLKPGGYLVLTVPGHRRVPAWFALDTDLPPHHLTLWSVKSMQSALAQAGYDVVDVKRSPLWSGDLVNYSFHRFAAFRRLDLIGRALRGISLFGIMPIVAKLISIRRESGGFTMMGIARKRI